jgi:two-component system, repressor protein LuxO
MTRKRILIVEDIPALALMYAGHLEKAGYEAVVVDTGAAVLRALAEGEAFSALLLDLQLPDIDGLELLRTNVDLLAKQPVIVVTADGSLSRAIEAMRLGAYDFLVKPLAAKRLLAVVASAVETGPTILASAHAQTADPRAPAATPGGFVGSCGAMREVYRQIGCIARSRATVLITGESGTGKEVCADSIHRESGRSGGAFIAINCGAIPENLLESELFGHVKGSFTGAVNDRIGAVQAAHKGTLFLDEVCEMALPLQVKLLRFLQTGTVQRVGTSRVDEVDVRIVCATNRDPLREVAEGRFREDLYYRLAVVPVHMPPLRERGSDIAELAETFLQRFSREEGKQFGPLGQAQMAALMAYRWPGNVRELQNVLRRAAVLWDGPDLPLAALPAEQGLVQMPLVPAALSPEASHGSMAPQPDLAAAFRGMTLDEIERLVIARAIDDAAGSLPAAARMLGVSASTLYRKRERWASAGEAA